MVKKVIPVTQEKKSFRRASKREVSHGTGIQPSVVAPNNKSETSIGIPSIILSVSKGGGGYGLVEKRVEGGRSYLLGRSVAGWSLPPPQKKTREKSPCNANDRTTKKNLHSFWADGEVDKQGSKVHNSCQRQRGLEKGRTG